MQVEISVLFIVGTRPGELWVLGKYLLKEGREGWRGCLGGTCFGVHQRRNEGERRAGWREPLVQEVPSWASGALGVLQFILKTEDTEKFISVL